MIKSVWIEIRPALRCSHICVVFKKKIDFTISIILKKSEFMIEIFGKRFNILFENFIADPLTFNCIQVVNDYLNFRVQVECKLTIDNIIPLKVPPPIFNESKSGLLCKCHNSLTKKIIFRRILPLPINEFSSHDIFCHFHDISPSCGMVITPNVDDCFYCDNFVTVNSELLVGCINNKQLLKCKRCLATVGICYKKYVSFWMSSLRLPFNTLTYLDQFKNFIKMALTDSILLFPKLLFQDIETNTYLSVVILEKNLIISTCKQNLKLKNTQVVKIKYFFHPLCDMQIMIIKNDPCNTSYHIQVQKCFMEYCVKYLISTLNSIPQIFSRIDNGCMTYIDLSN